jgi:hypothetical protein
MKVKFHNFNHALGHKKLGFLGNEVSRYRRSFNLLEIYASYSNFSFLLSQEENMKTSKEHKEEDNNFL